MAVTAVVVELLDTAAVLLAIPSLAGSRRLTQLRTAVVTDGDRPVHALLRLSKGSAMASGILVAIWFFTGIVGLGQVLDGTLFWIFDADSFLERAAVLAGTIVVLCLPLIRLFALKWGLGS